jgi:23S rRNA pseudouridine2605 synthase
MSRPDRKHKTPPRKAGGRPAPKTVEPAEANGPMRIAKAMARAGLCSRREAERWIADGRVSINGEVLKSPARDVKPGDDVKVDGQTLPTAEPPRLWRYYKPKGLVTTHRDPEGRPTVFGALPSTLPRVVSIGRLDFNSEGLLLLTNDGSLARHLELPATGWTRRYRVRAHGRITQEQLDGLKDGVEVEGVRYGPVEAALDKVQGANVWITVGLREGKNREVRKIMSSLGLEVNRLIRVSFGPFQLAEMEPGDVEPVKRRVLMEQLGPRLSKELGLEAAAEEERAEQRAARKRGWRGPSLDDEDDL